MILALALAMSLGAWAQGQLLTTISHDGNGDLLSGSRTFDGVATLTVAGNISYSSTDGWQTVYSNADGGSLTVTAADGYTIDSCRFIYGSESYTAAAAPFAVYPYANYSSFCVASDPAHEHRISYSMNGVQTIEVYGHQNGPTVTRTADNTWRFAMPGYNAALNIEYYPVTVPLPMAAKVSVPG